MAKERRSQKPKVRTQNQTGVVSRGSNRRRELLTASGVLSFRAQRSNHQPSRKSNQDQSCRGPYQNSKGPSPIRQPNRAVGKRYFPQNNAMVSICQRETYRRAKSQNRCGCDGHDKRSSSPVFQYWLNGEKLPFIKGRESQVTYHESRLLTHTYVAPQPRGPGSSHHSPAQ